MRPVVTFHASIRTLARKIIPFIIIQGSAKAAKVEKSGKEPLKTITRISISILARSKTYYHDSYYFRTTVATNLCERKERENEKNHLFKDRT